LIVRELIQMKRLKLSVILCLFAVLVMTANLSFSEKVYSWKDNQGRVHFGDKPKYQDEARKKVIHNYTVDHASMQRHDRRSKILKIESQDYNQKIKDDDLAKKKSVEVAVKCKRANEMHASYSTAQFLYKKGKDGERQLLPSEQKKNALAEVTSYIEKWCQ